VLSVLSVLSVFGEDIGLKTYSNLQG